MRERLALVFLVILRMAIGWHFLVEAGEKIESHRKGDTEDSRRWSSEMYFREAQGPAGKAMRWKLGDLDEQALARVTVSDSSPIPPPLAQEWNDYFLRFANHYGLDAVQSAAANEKLLQQKERTAVWFRARLYSPEWLLAGLWTDFDRKPFKHVAPVSPAGSIDVNQSVAERVEDYRKKLAEYRELLHDKPEALGKDFEKAHRAAVRADLTALRKELLDMVDGRTAEMKSSLAGVLNEEQKKKGPVPEPAVGWHFWFIDCTGWHFIDYVNWVTRYALLLIGAGLLLGLFTRSSALAGALFLLGTILAWPSLPWFPEPPVTEGHYLVISKNVIEMLALLMLACIPSGRWFGIDALIHAVNPWRKKEENT